MRPELLAEVERLYALGKAGHSDAVWLALAGERELAISCSRYVKPSSGWTFLHQAAYAGHEGSVRTLVRLGAALSQRSKNGESAADVARKRGHLKLAELMKNAEQHADSGWAAPTELDLLPSSCAWGEAHPRLAWRELRVSYAGGVVVIKSGARHYVDTFGRVVVGWHGTFDPPRGMDGEPML